MKKALSMVLALLMLMTLCITPVMAEEPEGSASNPYYVANPMNAPQFITIPANGAVYYQYKAAVFNGWSVSGYGLTSIIVDGVEYAEPNMWGEIKADFNFNFMSPGIVAYVNNTEEEVQVMLTHGQPVGTLENPAELSAGENALSIPPSIMDYVSVFVPMVNGDFTFSVNQPEDFVVTVFTNGSPAEGGTANPVENGSLTLTLESYMPVYVVTTPVGMTGDVVLTVTEPKAGTEANPIWLEADVAYELNGTDPLYFQVDGAWAGNQLLVESQNGTPLTLNLDGVIFTAENGSLYLDLDTTEWVMSLVVSQESADANMLYFSVKYAEGTMENPAAIELGDTNVSRPEGAATYYYSYVAEKDGLLVVTPSAVENIGYLAMNNADYSNYTYLSEGAAFMQMPVAAGEAITIEITAADDEETWVTKPLDIVLNLAQKDLVLYTTFEEGNLGGWDSSSVLTADDVEYASGWYSAKFEVTADWGNIFNYINLEANTDYVISFKAKAAKEMGAWIKFNKGWASDIASATVNLTTEWADYEVTLNSGELGTAVLMLQHAGYAADGQIIWIDDFCITKGDAETPEQPDPELPVEGNLFTNGTFEGGNADGWKTYQGSAASADAAKNGAYGFNAIGNGGWGGMFNQTVAVETGKTYKLSFWIKVVSNGVNIQVKDADGTKFEGSPAGWYDSNRYAEWTYVEKSFVAHADSLNFNVCGAGNGTPESAYFDSITLVQLPDPSFDGYITNGDFEMGDLTGWINLWDSCTVEFVEGYESDYAMSVVMPKQWQQVRQNLIPVAANTTYRLSAYVKNAQNVAFVIKEGNDSFDLTPSEIGAFPAGEDWQLFSMEFNTGVNKDGEAVTIDSICILVISYGEDGGSVIIDNITLEEVKPDVPAEPSFDGFITNGDFETGDLTAWREDYGTQISDTIAHGGKYSAYSTHTAKKYDLMLRQDGIAVKPGANYVLKFWYYYDGENATPSFYAYVKNGDQNIKSVTTHVSTAKTWSQVTLEFNAGECEEILVLFQNRTVDDGGIYYFDDIKLIELKDPSYDGYIYNGDFETGTLSNWTNLWGSCTVDFVEGKDGGLALDFTAGNWQQVRQDGIKVEANTDYVITAWVKNANNVGLIVKAGDDSGDIKSFGPATFDGWQQVTVEFNSGDQTSVCLLIIGWEGGGSAIVDDIVMTKAEPAAVAGDADGDGELNNRDLGLLQQYINEWAVEVNAEVCDLNGDGKINNKDLALLQRILAGWDVVLG